MPANYCALTFDDGPGPYTAPLLDLLAERGIPATFFVLGQNAQRRPDLIKRMLAEGHEIASHGYSHANMRRLKSEAQLLEMKRTQEVLQPLGAKARYFRPPYGRYKAQTVAQAQALGMTLMLWSLDSQDWKNHVSRLEGLRSISPHIQQAFPGLRGVFLFHDTHKHTVDEMADILDALIAGGCERFVTISEYMFKAPLEEEHRLSTQAPDEGRGEMPPALAGGMNGAVTEEDLAPRLSGEMRQTRRFGAGMGTLAAHPVRAQIADMRTRVAHGASGGLSPAVPELLMTGIVTDGQGDPAAGREAPPQSPAPLSLGRSVPSVASEARPPVAVKGQIPQLSNPDVILPAHKPNRGGRLPGRDANGPG
jgi:peptidoglycan/xylan/chitin deacetylase (PgdA/CDA1 family)